MSGSLSLQQIEALLRSQRTARADLALEVIEALAEHPQTIHQLVEELDYEEAKVRRGIHHARELLAAEGGREFIVCEPQGARRPWLYSLVEGAVVVDAGQSGWLANRIGDTETRIRTELGAIKTAVAATSPASILGRKARLLQTNFAYLVEMFDLIGTGRRT